MKNRKAAADIKNANVVFTGSLQSAETVESTGSSDGGVNEATAAAPKSTWLQPLGSAILRPPH
ncbi:hypothetical protein ACER0C_003086 [Sarotherodon galilaeus]